MSSTAKEETNNNPQPPKNNNNGKQNNNSNGNGNAKKQARLCPGRDSYERMNFLYQASVLMAESAPALSGCYGKLMKAVGKKAVLRVEPAIKRTLCARCGVALSSSSTASYSDFRHKKLSYVEVRCKLCAFSKRYYENKKHRIRLDDPAAVVETMEFN
ncbi:hypothetical protein quinque_001805 [Culex quinquefasciatus]|uniref:ribonuclease P protein subunit rpr2 isoform X2 n=1 Tax=Culex quinquefasciatus TaxID=7176 RepID=UPI0018E398FC|nr:ribonuclease P protein subunit rpr2 isoform X2 [Culex quinquefasciatus]XP_038114804.1 ribonuclease P protein subunit rpr2 isoform X2 [Culex quinquefasciatus]